MDVDGGRLSRLGDAAEEDEVEGEVVVVRLSATRHDVYMLNF